MEFSRFNFIYNFRNWYITWEIFVRCDYTKEKKTNERTNKQNE